ncbi:hypothetical protein HMPREF0663_12047 [Hoylesella oralis ATCC 33269]|uniref:Uncharacterized protein n=1 Tax=Hoylesella oralis ATCC 33269 TaxID=873533 RepID=E7RTH4_9BACT|nr:hypothetical protein HMPREF0663_12047 [Hoylesella oralis ATCC 33269]
MIYHVPLQPETGAPPITRNPIYIYNKVKTTNDGRLAGLGEHIPTNAERLAEPLQTPKYNGC